ncbi:MAG: ComF family protein [Polyangiaceae bacterium]
MSLVDVALEALLAILSPPACAACDAPLERARVFCAACAATVVATPPAPRGAHTVSAAAYGGAVATAIVRLKYGGRADLARPLAHLAFPVAASLGVAFDVVAPVPLHPARLRERGFNQAALLAAPLARFLGARYAPQLLTRLRSTTPQATQGAAARAANVVGAFSLAGRALSPDARVLLVDDVRTTGATLSACFAALGGSSRAWAVTLAQAGDA